MSQNQKTVWFSNTILILTILLNAVVIKIAFTENQNLFWILIVSVPLLVTALFNSKQINILLRKYFIDSLQPFVRQTHFEWLLNSSNRDKIDEADLRVLIGNDQCRMPYDMSILNIGSKKNLSFKNNSTQGIKERGLFYTSDSSQKKFSAYRIAPGSFIWQLGPDYSGCSTESAHFDSKAFKQIACHPEVKMIELRLSAAIISGNSIDSFSGIADSNEIKTGNSIFGDSAYTTFNEAEGMIHFFENLRELSGGKPMGLRLCVGKKKEFYQICHAIRKTGIIPDFIVVEGVEKEASSDYTDQAHTGMPLYEALQFVLETLRIYTLEKKIRVIAAAKVSSGFDILKVLALGANAVFTEMHDYRIHENSVNRKRRFFYKAQHISGHRNNLINGLMQLMKVCGFRNGKDITLSDFFRNLDIIQSNKFSAISKSVSYQGSVRKMDSPKINSHRIKAESKEKLIEQ